MLNQACNSPAMGPSEDQRRVDEIVAAARQERRPLFRPPSAPLQPLEPTRDPCDLRLSEELDFARRLLESMGDQLAADPIILQRHMQTVQGFDRIAQILGHVAKVMATQDKLAAIDRIGMNEMRARLTRRAL